MLIKVAEMRLEAQTDLLKWKQAELKWVKLELKTKSKSVAKRKKHQTVKCSNIS